MAGYRVTHLVDDSPAILDITVAACIALHVYISDLTRFQIQISVTQILYKHANVHLKPVYNITVWVRIRIVSGLAWLGTAGVVQKWFRQNFGQGLIVQE